MNLHNLEKKILLVLKRERIQTIQELMNSTGLDQASVNHASAWLMAKKLVNIDEQTQKQISLGKEGKDYLKNGIPERKALNLLSARELSVTKAREKLGKQADIAITWLIKQGIIKIENRMIRITENAKRWIREQLPQEQVLNYMGNNEGKTAKEIEKDKGPTFTHMVIDLSKRGNILIIKEIKTRTVNLTQEGEKVTQGKLEIVNETSQITPQMLKDGTWKTVNLRKYNVEMPVEKTYPGRYHPVTEVLEHARRVWLDMGFKEMKGPIIDSEFWVFDALFTPQDHPAREMQDTLFVEGTQKLDKKLVERVKTAHEKGVDGSRGWQYKFDEKISEKLIMRTHTTSLSARTLSKLKKTELPAKFFAVGRVFRNETLDWKHGFEFNQTEGIVIDPDANFRNLMGYLKEFIEKLGFHKFRFKPKYFPYTEMSMTAEVWNEERKEWYELFGSGIFRPELTEPLLGEPIPVLAWGLGIDRLYTEYYKFERFNEIFKNDVKKLREVPQWGLK